MKKIIIELSQNEQKPLKIVEVIDPLIFAAGSLADGSLKISSIIQ